MNAIKNPPRLRGGGSRVAADGGGWRPGATQLKDAPPLHHRFAAVPLPASGEDF